MWGVLFNCTFMSSAELMSFFTAKDGLTAVANNTVAAATRERQRRVMVR